MKRRIGSKAAVLGEGIRVDFYLWEKLFNIIRSEKS